jgi:type I restriction enzyme S subunit
MMRKSKATAGQFNLTLEICRNLLIPLCFIPEQQAIVEEIEARLSVVDNLEATLATALHQAQALRQSILKQAFAGKLVPQDPDDEPAAKLLKRIARP